jgi:hypothetical protein
MPTPTLQRDPNEASTSWCSGPQWANEHALLVSLKFAYIAPITASVSFTVQEPCWIPARCARPPEPSHVTGTATVLYAHADGRTHTPRISATAVCRAWEWKLPPAPESIPKVIACGLQQYSFACTTAPSPTHPTPPGSPALMPHLGVGTPSNF